MITNVIFLTLTMTIPPTILAITQATLVTGPDAPTTPVTTDAAVTTVPTYPDPNVTRTYANNMSQSH